MGFKFELGIIYIYTQVEGKRENPFRMKIILFNYLVVFGVGLIKYHEEMATTSCFLMDFNNIAAVCYLNRLYFRWIIISKT